MQGLSSGMLPKTLKYIFIFFLVKYWLIVIFCNNLSEVNRTLQKLADTYTENTEFLNKLADQTENFAVQLIDQVTAKEELVMKDLPEYVDRYASMLSDMTDDAIIHSQKKVRSLLYRPIVVILFPTAWTF